MSVNSDGMITMALTDNGGTFAAPNTFDNNLEYMMWGNDNGSLVESTVEVPSPYSKRLPREWVIQETGTVGTVSIQFNISALTVTGTTIADFALIIDQDKDGNFLTGTIRKIAPTSYAGGILTFNAVDFANGEIYSLATAKSTLPLQFVRLEAETQESQNIVSWITADINNSLKFEVLRSMNGMDWDAIGEVKIENNNINQYNFVDNKALNNTRYYYRIREVAKNGYETYSGIISTSQTQNNQLHFEVYPIPAKQNLFIQLDEVPPSSDPVDVIMYSADGKIIYKSLLYDMKNVINLKGFNSGTYIIELIFDHTTHPQRKIIVIE